MQKPYNIGLDIGTNSVGWAVIDDEFNVIRKGNKRTPLWGVRLFEAATPAAERRSFRSTRRRYDRRRERIKLLQEEFKEEINLVDSTFFQKLKTSKISPKDTENKKVILTDYDKKEIFSNSVRKLITDNNGKTIPIDNKYPTIYHLRKDLMERDDKVDIRLIYLAIHHIIKYRGNFNYNIDNFNINNLDVKDKIINILFNFKELLPDICTYQEVPFKEDENVIKFENICMEINRKDKQKLLEKWFYNYFHKNVSKAIADALVGYKFNIDKLFAIELNKDKNSLSFLDTNFDENVSKLEEIDDLIELIYLIKELYDMISLKQIFKNKNHCSISKLMVENYNEHKRDLKELKMLVKPHKEIYKNLFKNSKDLKHICLYEKYINNSLSYEDFTKNIIEILDKIKNNDNTNIIKNIKLKIENNQFMPRINDTGNGKYPYQINEEELKTIIEKQKKYYPFLGNKLDDGSYKIVKLLTFRIPYYVGPLVNSKYSQFAWMERKLGKENEKITPFNFDEIVDTHESAKKFIYKMLGHCTYLLDKYRIPDNSILYSKFKVLNELKQIKINDKKIPIEIQHQIYNELFLKEKNITDSLFKKYLRININYSMYYDDIEVKGYSAENKFANNMKSYIDFFGKDGIFKNTNLTIEDAEKIIMLLTVFEDRKIVEEELKISYPNLKDKYSRILKLNYKGWGNLSRELLETPYYVDEETNTSKSIIDLMWETEENFVQILNNKKYKFQEMINQHNKSDIKTISYDLVDNLATSPKNKKGIYQALKIIKEITDYMGYDPKNISIEMARSNDKKKRTKDRKKQLLEIYDENKKNINNYNTLKKELKERDKIDNDRLYLYFKQEGKCLYTMDTLDINKLSDYDIDHILPQSLIKDDSIDNKALVIQDKNRSKKDNLTISDGIKNKYKYWWKHLNDIGLISNKKYNNLVREDFNDKDIKGFINRQLVETRQITIHVANIIKNLYKNTKIIYYKANTSSYYREKFKLYKYRDLNDYHHAHDAYLAITLGIYQEKYLKKEINKLEFKLLIDYLIKEKKYNELKYGYIINSIDQDLMDYNHETGEVFNVKDFTDKIENNLYRTDILISKKTEIKTGEFYNQTKNKKGKIGVSLKKNMDTNLYGSYTGVKPSYAILVKYSKKESEERKLIGIPIHISILNNQEILLNYIKKLLNIDNINSIEIIKDKIPFYTIIDWEGQICSLVGATDKVEVCNAKQFEFSKEKQIIWKNTLNRLFNKCEKDINDLLYNSQLKEIINYVIEKIEKEYKLYNNLIPELRSYLTDNIIDELVIEEKEKVLIELFKLLKFNSSCANLKFLNSSASICFGKKNGKTISNPILIHQSITGLKEKKYEF